MNLTYDLVAARDPFVLIRDGMTTRSAQSFARTITSADDPYELATVLLAGALEVHPREINTLRASGAPCDRELRNALGGLLADIASPLQDLPERLFTSLLIELGNGRDARALTIVQVHHNT